MTPPIILNPRTHPVLWPCFEAPFWDTSVDYFGAACDDKPGGGGSDGDDGIEPGGRGRMFMFWNLEQASC